MLNGATAVVAAKKSNSAMGRWIWFLRRPLFWKHFLYYVARRFYPNLDSEHHRETASRWAASKTVTVGECLQSIGLTAKIDEYPKIDKEIIDDANERAKQVSVQMGGPGDINLIYAVSALIDGERFVETGVAYGWSSLVILAAISERSGAKLASVDMPYPNKNNEKYVGVVVPNELRKQWKIIKEPDRSGLKKAIRFLGGEIDFCHYDSDKLYWGRKFAYPILWKALRKGGIFISDDIQDNMAFEEFVEGMGIKFCVTKSGEKYVGVCRK